MTIINLTPHQITLLDSENNIQKIIPASGRIARLSVKTEKAFMLDDVQVTKTVFGEPVDLPEEEDTIYDDPDMDCYEMYGNNTYYIVSQIIKSRFPERGDLLVPAEMQRDADGNIIGCRSLGI